MSKKRERATPEAGVDHGPDPSSAESLLFQLASDSSTADLHQSKRVKSEHSIKNSSSIDVNIAGKDVASSAPVRIAKEKHPAAVAPSSNLRHCDGLDVVRKGSRGRGRQLMILPGVLGLGKSTLGGKLGMLKDITSATPVLYVEFPETGSAVPSRVSLLILRTQAETGYDGVHCRESAGTGPMVLKGRLKCTGRTIHTKGRFFTLYADKASNKSTRMDCRDVFDSVVCFSKACWVGRVQDNPSEDPLRLPDSLQVDTQTAEVRADERSLNSPVRFTNAKPPKPPPEQSLSEDSAGNAGKDGFRTYFGGGNPNSPLKATGNLARRHSKGNEGEGSEPKPAAEVTREGSPKGEEAPAAAAADAAESQARRSSRATKSKVTYVEDSDDIEDGDEGDGSSSGVESGVAVAGVGKEDGVEPEAEPSEEFSILDAPTVERKPATVGSGRAKSAKKASPKTPAKDAKKRQSSGAAKGKGRRTSSSDSDDGGSDGGDGGKVGDDDSDTPAFEDNAVSSALAGPSRRSRRSSAMSQVKYTQSSESEEEEAEDGGQDEDGDDDEEEYEM